MLFDMSFFGITATDRAYGLAGDVARSPRESMRLCAIQSNPWHTGDRPQSA
jgi:hypothetical protein